MERQRVLYFHANTDIHALVERMRDHDWDVIPFTEIESAASQTPEQSIGLGLIHFGAAVNRDPKERLMRTMPATAWVGIPCGNPVSRRLESRMFPGKCHDDPTEPVDWRRRAYRPRPAHGMARASRHTRTDTEPAVGADAILGASNRLAGGCPRNRKIAPVATSVVNGAQRRKVGRHEAADAGPFCLDAVADLPLDHQVNLLRFLQGRAIEPVGGINPLPLNGRVAAARPVDLPESVSRGRSREARHYRLNGNQVRMATRRERIDVIEPLARCSFFMLAKERDHHALGCNRHAGETARPRPDGAPSSAAKTPTVPETGPRQ